MIHVCHEFRSFFNFDYHLRKMYICYASFRARLPPYVLDFGHVVLGTVRTHIVRATNTGWFPVSFSVNRDYLYQYGFNIELDRVRQLPGAPDHETVDFEVSFDPRGANLGLGKVATVVPMNVSYSKYVYILWFDIWNY